MSTTHSRNCHQSASDDTWEYWERSCKRNPLLRYEQTTVIVLFRIQLIQEQRSSIHIYDRIELKTQKAFDDIDEYLYYILKMCVCLNLLDADEKTLTDDLKNIG